MVRLIMLVVLVVVVLLAVRVALDAARGTAQTLRRRRAAGHPSGSPGSGRRDDQSQLRLPAANVPQEPREEMVAWVVQHREVEAYVEPKTMMSPLTVVFIDDRGDWKRFPLTDDRFVRELAKERGIPVFDASRVGYPERMRRGRRSVGDEE